ncbi:hypothetical protein CYMTET_32233 [Cymbomonas tetramitiformis]|uniref:Uncharacterized protein n=1 Tax=Cymbomonas tetramitiformis TaxID=36881 RepID=A0AAE0FF86_9CHLO|nr:hypothetical protein CYMTET_32233 [Cymbomonas tetramitiformis]
MHGHHGHHLFWKREELWSYILKTVQQAVEAKEAGNDVLFNLADATKESSDYFLGRTHLPLGNYEELSTIFFGPKDDPDPLVTQFDECLKASAASSSAGPLNVRQAMRQLLASLDEDIYKEVTPSDHTVGVAYSGLPSSMDVQRLIADFQFHIDAAHEMLNFLKDNMDDDEPPRRWPTPSPDKPTDKPGCASPLLA